MRIIELLSGSPLHEDSPVGPNSPWNPHQMGPKGSVPPFVPAGGGMQMGANAGGGMQMAANSGGGGDWVGNKWGPPAGQMPGNMNRPPAPVAPTPAPGNMGGGMADATPMAPGAPMAAPAAPTPASPIGPSGGTMSSTPSEPTQTA